MQTLEQFKERSGAAREFLMLLRDFAIVAVVILVVVYPPAFANWLARANIKSFAWGDMKVEMLERAAQQAAAASGKMADAEDSNKALIKQIDDAIKADESLRPRLGPILTALRQSQTNLNSAQHDIDRAALDQREALEKAAPEKVVQTGWVATNFLSADGGIRPGALAIVLGPRPLNIRTGGGTAYGTVGILPPNTKVRVLNGPVRGWAEIKTE